MRWFWAGLVVGLMGCTSSGTLNFGDGVSHGIAQVPGVEDPSALIFDDAVLPQFGIELDNDAYASLRKDPYTWVEGSFTYEGRTWEPVGIRIKGENSFLPIDEKPSLKVKFNKYVQGGRFLGLRELTLNNMSSDYSMMHERIAYRMYREFGVPAARSHHALVTVNGESYGLYANVENVDRELIERWFEDPAGTMFEVWDVDFYDEYIPDFQLEYGEDDRTNLQGVADALEGSGSASLTAAAAHLDVASFQKYWAVGAFVGQFDSYPYSMPGDDCHVYDDPTTGTLHFIPHGLDETFYQPERRVAERVNGIVGARCVAVSSCRDGWIELVAEVLDLADEIDILGYFDEVAEQIEEHIRDDDHKPYSNGYVWATQDNMREMIEGRRAELKKQLDL